MAQKLEPIIISNVIPSGAAFGVKVNGGQGVYISPKVASSGDMSADDIGEQVLAVLGENRQKETPWRALFIDWEERIKTDPADYVFLETGKTGPTTPLPEPQRDLPPDSNGKQGPSEFSLASIPRAQLEAMILDALRESCAPIRTRHLADKIAGEPVDDLESNTVGHALDAMWKEGKVARADLRASGSQQKSSMLFWAYNIEAITSRLAV